MDFLEKAVDKVKKAGEKKEWEDHTAAWQRQIETITDEHGMLLDSGGGCLMCDAVGKMSKNGRWQDRWLCIVEGGICRSTKKMGKGKNPFVSFSDIDGFDTMTDDLNVFVVRVVKNAKDKNGKDLKDMKYKVLKGDSVPTSCHSRKDWISKLRQVGVALLVVRI